MPFFWLCIVKRLFSRVFLKKIQNNYFFVNVNSIIITLIDCFIKQYNGKEEEEQQQQQQQQQAVALAEAYDTDTHMLCGSVIQPPRST